MPITAVPWRRFSLFLEPFALGASNVPGDGESLLLEILRDNWFLDFSSVLLFVVLVSSVIMARLVSPAFFIEACDLD